MSTTGPMIEGNLAIDLVNTEEELWGVWHDYIETPEAFCNWLSDEELAGAVSKVQLPLEVELWASDRMVKVHQFRQEVRFNLQRLSAGEGVSPQFVERLEGYVERAPLTMKLNAGKVVYVPVGDSVEKLCSLVAVDILRMIDDGRIDRLRKCANPKCMFMFVDTSGRRKWCSMQRCGNRIKVTRHIRRRNAGER
ncbi:MAG: CGNR zinc finger domain-containing protein [Alicyclobacillus sp.]|nr:CGNR zinc finger domain-containing protein [Alicyclobacillus sp.]